MRIGLVSDTHGFLDETLAQHFQGCDEIWHAGDIGDASVIAGLEQIAPVLAVYGNIDDPAMQRRYPENLRLQREGVSILITHIAGKVPSYTTRVKKLLREQHADVLICGHSHICQVKKDASRNLLFINPGAAGQQGFHLMRTVIRLELGQGKIGKLEVVELGKRGITS
ncbi:MAG: metallophosphoesterase family protein [Cyclobacteriaceae bacterium]|nr:metallophosphoesterase family protein [Cyclobacteriaceae bacterium]